MQGVGFRPFVYQLASKLGLPGWVNNTIDGVHIEFNATPGEAERFFRQLQVQAPPLSRITAQEMKPAPPQFFEDFRIIKSEDAGEADLLLTPDFALCRDCRAELVRQKDRRFQYAFITCTNCGPRFSIVEALPYDRERTAMAPFRMCAPCREEYEDPLDRRYYSQTNSCRDCGVSLVFFSVEAPLETLPNEAALDAAVAAIRRGGIVAVKGIGGFLLMVDAANPDAVQRLRKRKRRPGKPFALMYPDLGMLKGDAEVPPQGEVLLQGAVSPILLLKTHRQPASGLDLDGIAPGLQRVGAMLPYAPLYELLLAQIGGPVIATSGNVSNTPILFEEEKARRELPEVADFVLTHNRSIAVPQDDSVVRFSPRHSQRILIRRSRGLAPTLIVPGIDWPQESLLATGASLKSTFGLVHRGNVYVSQYLGDLTNFDTQEHYRHTLDHFLRLFRLQPARILADLHPDYFSTRLAQERAQRKQVPLDLVQHHLAHFAAVLGENQLLDSSEPVLGVIWDGTGYGEDLQIWGGELFLYQDYVFRRQAHLPYYPHLAGDKMPREPRLSALALSYRLKAAEERLREKFTPTEWRIYRQLLHKKDGLRTSSMGRLFDGMASLLNLMDRSTYEGEAAMRLEQLAEQYLQGRVLDAKDNYLTTTGWGWDSLVDVLLEAVLRDLDSGVEPGCIAARFHYSLACSIAAAADDLKVKHLAFSGGVFQNGLLIDLLREAIPSDCNLYFHRELSPNDECIAFGQLVFHWIQRQGKTGRTIKNTR